MILCLLPDPSIICRMGRGWSCALGATYGRWSIHSSCSWSLASTSNPETNNRILHRKCANSSCLYPPKKRTNPQHIPPFFENNIFKHTLGGDMFVPRVNLCGVFVESMENHCRLGFFPIGEGPREHGSNPYAFFVLDIPKKVPNLNDAAHGFWGKSDDFPKTFRCKKTHWNLSSKVKLSSKRKLPQCKDIVFCRS